MMNKLVVSWSVNRPPPLADSRGGSQHEPGWRLVDYLLGAVEDLGGSVTLEFLDQSELGPDHLQLAAEKGKYLLTLLEHTNDRSIVRDFTNPDAKAGMVSINGNLWDEKMICTDFRIVRSAFKEFFDTGDVSRKILHDEKKKIN